MNRYITTDIRTGEIVHEGTRNPWLQPLRQKPAYKPSKRRRPRNDPLIHLVFLIALLAVVGGVWLGNRVDVSFNW